MIRLKSIKFNKIVRRWSADAFLLEHTRIYFKCLHKKNGAQLTQTTAD